MSTILKTAGGGTALALMLVGTAAVNIPKPAHAVSPGWAAAIGVGSFALGAAVANPYGYGYAYPYYGYGYGYPAYGYGYGYPAYGYGPYYGYGWR